MIVLLPNEGIIFLEIKGGLIGYKAKDQHSPRLDVIRTRPFQLKTLLPKRVQHK